MYEVTGDPFSTALVHETLAEPLPPTATTPVGADGASMGVAVTDTAADAPAMFEAVTTNV